MEDEGEAGGFLCRGTHLEEEVVVALVYPSWKLEEETAEDSWRRLEVTCNEYLLTSMMLLYEL